MAIGLWMRPQRIRSLHIEPFENQLQSLVDQCTVVVAVHNNREAENREHEREERRGKLIRVLGPQRYSKRVACKHTHNRQAVTVTICAHRQLPQDIVDGDEIPRCGHVLHVAQPRLLDSAHFASLAVRTRSNPGSHINPYTRPVQ